MEQEETKTTAAAGVEMPPEAENWVQLHESELTELMQKQAKAAITELKRQEKQERKKEKYHNTFMLMKCYRDMAFHIENAISDGQQLELKGMTDEQQRTYLESIRRTRFKHQRCGLNYLRSICSGTTADGKPQRPDRSGCRLPDTGSQSRQHDNSGGESPEPVSVFPL